MNRCWCGVESSITHSHPDSAKGITVDPTYRVCPPVTPACSLWADGQHLYEPIRVYLGSKAQTKVCACGSEIFARFG